MKQFFLIQIILFFCVTCFATDLLIVDKDTFYLKTYPLETLQIKQRPFGLNKQAVNAANQYPGYQAVWRIVEGKLYLEKIISFSGDTSLRENIVDLFKKNAIQYQTNGKMIFADWLTITYYSMEPYSKKKGSIIFLAGSFSEKYNGNKALLRFEKGFVKMNNLPKDYR